MVQKGSLVGFLWGFLSITAPKWDFPVSLLSMKVLDQMISESYRYVEKRREEKGKGEKERYTHLNAEFQRIARRKKKAFLSDQRNRGKQ